MIDVSTVELWAFDPIQRFLEHRAQASITLQLVTVVLGTSTDGRLRDAVAAMSTADRAAMLEAVSSPNDPLGLLFANDLVAAWSSLEALVYDSMAQWLLHNDVAWDAPILQNVKVKVMPFARLSRADQARRVVAALRGEQSITKEGYGVGRYEALLKALGFTQPTLPSSLQKSLLELGHIRNVWAHTSGVADEAFVAAKPPLKWALGERVYPSVAQYRHYAAAVHDYALLLMQRLVMRLAQFGVYLPEGAELPPWYAAYREGRPVEGAPKWFTTYLAGRHSPATPSTDTTETTGGGSPAKLPPGQ